MTVRTALQLINRFLSEDDFDNSTQFCLSWFETIGWAEGRYGDAEVLARAKGTSVGGLIEAAVVDSSKGNLRSFRWIEYADNWNPKSGVKISTWEALHHLIRAINQEGEHAAAVILARMSELIMPIRILAYRLYTLSERMGLAEEARAYNGIIYAWPAIETLACEIGHSGSQMELDL